MEDTDMKKAIKKYMKPSFRVVELQHKCQILAGSGDPKRDVPWWDGEGDARRHNGVWDDEDN
jgi:hypothetical protein